MSIKTIFLDRDGVINKDNNYVYKISEFEFMNEVFNTCLYFRNLGYELIIITNQSGISRGYFNENQYKALTEWMLTQFQQKQIKILDIYHCPHGPKSNCLCRKPMPGLIFEAKRKYNIDMDKSWMIGDSERDIEAANNAKLFNTILINDDHKLIESNALYIVNSIEKIRNIITN